MADEPHPTRLKLIRDRHLEIDWSDGLRVALPLPLLRRRCPCATCKEARAEQKVNRLAILQAGGGGGGPLVVRSAEPVGNYAIRLTWSDGHDAGLYSWATLRTLSEEQANAL